MAGVLLSLIACKTTEGPVVPLGSGGDSHGGAEFRKVQVQASLPAEALYRVCWPPEATQQQSVELIFGPNGAINFQAHEGASNSTARCIREIAASYPWATRPDGPVLVYAPRDPATGWEVLAWVKLLSPSRYGPERGITDPTGLVAACLQRGGGQRPGTRFGVSHDPSFSVRVIPTALTDGERCVEAVLGATAWPSTRSFSLSFESGVAPAPEGDVSAYLAPTDPASPPLEPMRVKETLGLKQADVSRCWEAALARRAGIGGGRTFRFRTDASGAMARVWVAGNASDALTAADYLLDACLVSVLRQVHFAEGAGDGVYTWVFASRG